ncbi:MAG: hypothetical protein ACHQEM_00085 [Chitinophagales bacterium]
MDSQDQSLETLQDIKRIMERSTRFISLSGLSGLSAGIFALIGAYIAHGWLQNHADGELELEALKWRLVILALSVLSLALASAFFFTWRKARKNNLPLWDRSSRNLLINLLIPLITGGLFVMALYSKDEWRFVAPACLIFYGLSLVNASKYTLGDIRYVGMIDILLGLAGMYYTNQALYLWAIGFGLLHIVYGLIMWWKYDWKQEND